MIEQLRIERAPETRPRPAAWRWGAAIAVAVIAAAAALYGWLPRAVPIGEAMLSIVLADALLEKLGGDSIEEMRPRFESLRGNRLSDLPMDNAVLRFGYE